MSTTVQHRRGTTNNHSTFVGAPGEITVDTTKNVAVIHDGATAGGHPQIREVDVCDVNRYSRVIVPPANFNGSQATARSLGDLSLKATYMGCSPRRLRGETVVIRARVTTAYTAGTSGSPWAEMGIAVGPVIAGSNPSLSVIAWTDVSAMLTVTGVLSVPVEGVTINDGVDWWIVAANSIGAGGGPTSAAFRSFAVGDDIITGVQGTAANIRPSQVVNGQFDLVLDANNVNALWMALIIP